MPSLTYSAGDRVRIATYTVAGLGGLTGEVLKSEINAFGVEEVTISVVEALGRAPSRCSFAASELERLPDPIILPTPFHGPHVVLFFGSRDLTYHKHGPTIGADVRSLGGGSVVLHGGQRGADLIADAYGRQYAHERKLHVARVDALWDAYGKHAGPLRNNVMARMLRPTYAFGYPMGGPGSAGMIDILKRERIPYTLRELSA